MGTVLNEMKTLFKDARADQSGSEPTEAEKEMLELLGRLEERLDTLEKTGKS